MPVQLGASRFDGKLPLDLESFCCALFDNRPDFSFQFRFRGHAPMQALTGNGREFDLLHVEPRGFLRRVIKLEALRERKGFFRRERLVQRTQVVRVQVVLHRPDFHGLRILRRQLSEE